MSHQRHSYDPIRDPWISLYEKYNHKYRSEGDDAVFKTFTGVPIQVAERIFIDYQHQLFLPTRDILLMVLHFLKSHETENDATGRFYFGSRNTYRKKLWKAIFYLDTIMDEISLEERFSKYCPLSGPSIFNRVSMVIDGTQCPIFCPNGMNTTKADRISYFSGRSKDNTYSRYNLNYTVGVHIKTGQIVYVGGPHKGKVNDIECVRREGLIGTILSKDPYELILADKGYIGEPIFVTPIKKPKNGFLTEEESGYNRVIASVRQIVECSLNRLKNWGCLGRNGRWKLMGDEGKHKAVFNVCCQITNIAMQRNPVWSEVNWYLRD
jgi:hypothetical protein